MRKIRSLLAKVVSAWMGTFAEMQPVYARHGIATYPVRDDKRPATKGFQHVGLRGSQNLASKFSEADALGFVAGRRNRLTIIDIDSTDEKLVSELEQRFGTSPLQVLTPSGGRHLYFRHAGEPRKIRPLPDVDILGAGPVVGINSRFAKGAYTIVRGSIDDLARLPSIRGKGDFAKSAQRDIGHRGRNDQVFKHCLRQAPYCEDLENLLDCARTLNDDFEFPLDDPEVMKTAQSAWQYQVAGRNWYSCPGVSISKSEIEHLWNDGDVLLLLMRLRSENGPDARFLIADGWVENLRWSLTRLRAARKALVDLGYIVLVSAPKRGHAAVFRWTDRSMAYRDR